MMTDKNERIENTVEALEAEKVRLAQARNHLKFEDYDLYLYLTMQFSDVLREIARRHDYGKIENTTEALRTEWLCLIQAISDTQVNDPYGVSPKYRHLFMQSKNVWVEIENRPHEVVRPKRVIENDDFIVEFYSKSDYAAYVCEDCGRKDCICDGGYSVYH